MRFAEALEELVSLMPNAIAMFDREMRYVAASARWRKDYCLPAGRELRGRSQYEVFPEIPERWKEAHRRGLAGESSQMDEDHFTRCSGRVQWLRWEVHPWYGDDGSVGGILIQTEDLTERKAIQQALVQSENQLLREVAVLQRLRRVGQEVVRDGDLAALANDIMNAAVDLAGADKGNIQLLDAIDGKLRIIAHRGFEQAFLEHFRAVEPADTACGCALQQARCISIPDVRNSSAFSETGDRGVMLNAGVAACCSTPLVTRAGVVIGIVSVFFATPHIMAEGELRALDLLARQAADVLDQAEAQRVVREQRDHLRAVLDTVVDAIITIDAKGVIRSINPATERMFGYSAAELLGQNVSVLMPSPYREEHNLYLERYHRTGEPHVIGIGREVRGQRKDGTVFPLDLAVGREDDCGIFTGVLRDITARKQAETQLRLAERLAAIGTLAAGLGHDMHNILLPLRAHLSVVRAEQDQFTSQCRESVEAVAGSVAYLQQLADGLHFLAMDPDADGGAFTNLATWWKNVSPVVSKAMPREVSLAASLPPDLPDVRIDSHALTQAVLNLIVNASDAIRTERRHRQGRVEIWARAQGAGKDATVQIGVSDNGPGMTDEVRRRAFDVLFTTKPGTGGTGLGLAMVHRIVQQRGGTAAIESSDENGTTVVLTLPAPRSTAADVTAASTAVVSVRDGRTAGLVSQLLRAAGMRSSITEAPGHASTWIVEPTKQMLPVAREWRERLGAKGRLVLLGRGDSDSKVPSPEWASLQPVAVVADAIDFEAIRQALSKTACHPQSG